MPKISRERLQNVRKWKNTTAREAKEKKFASSSDLAADQEQSDLPMMTDPEPRAVENPISAPTSPLPASQTSHDAPGPSSGSAPGPRGDPYIIHKVFAMSDSAIHNPRLCKGLVDGFLLPADRAEQGRHPLGQVLNDCYYGMYQASLQLSHLSAFLSGYDEVKRKLTHQLEICKKDLEETIAKAEEYKSSAEEAQTQLKAERDKSMLLLSEVERERDGLRVSLRDAEREVKICRSSIQKLCQEADLAEEKAIEKYKASEEFVDDVAEESLSVYHEGFKECQEKIQLFLPDFDVSQLTSSVPKPDESSEGAEAKEVVREATDVIQIDSSSPNDKTTSPSNRDNKEMPDTKAPSSNIAGV